MNHDSDKEMDILLRRHNRRGAGSVSGTSHMDADELGAYAEGALPDAARARYASHLADCDSCRKIVTELVLSSEVEVKESTVVQAVEAPRRSWRTWLAALFSPPVLRYAAPAVALFAFAAIVLVVVTRNRDVTTFVTQNEPNRTQSSDTKTAAPGDGQGTGSATNQVDNNHGNTSSAANANASSQNSATTPAPLAQREAQPQTETPVVEGVSTATSNTASVAANEPQPPPPARIQERGADTKDAAKPASQPNDTLAADRAKEKDDEFAVEQKRAESNEAAAGGTASTTNTTTRRGRKAEGAGGGAYGVGRSETSDEERQRPQTAKSAPATTAGARRDTSGRDEDSTAETRMVAGRRFRQQNGVWVDTAYSSSRSVIRVRRGSEQYRALVADEPVIETVANSFSGDVIVVVRGKAYRITQ